jgi:hypothetical protein
MSRKQEVSVTTLRRNIAKDSHRYHIEHKTHLLIARLAKQEKRTAGAFLDLLIEQVAGVRLPPGEVERATAQAREIEEERRREAETHQPELLAKRRRKRATMTEMNGHEAQHS